MMGVNIGDYFSFTGLGSAMASLMFLSAMVNQLGLDSYLPSFMSAIANRFSFLYLHMEITFFEYTGDEWSGRSDAYSNILSYLASRSAERARRLKAEFGQNRKALELSMEDYEEIVDVFNGVKVRWRLEKIQPRNNTFNIGRSPRNDRRYYSLRFLRGHRRFVIEEYLPYVMDEGQTLRVRQRKRKIYTNQSTYDDDADCDRLWTGVPFKHPATFETLAMEKEEKEKIIKDLLGFRRAKEYYKRIGKPWKRGYLLYGPPGTGKSTTIAAMANLLDYDVYDLELTTVQNNSMLRKLLIETTSKSIIVIEDIDCSLDLAGKRDNNNDNNGDDDNSDDDDKDDDKEEKPVMGKQKRNKKKSKVTLSGLLNFIDGLWSGIGDERLIVFTTNHLDKLDPALIRRGRMDKHICLSYCSFEAFKILAKNYLGIESHALFETIGKLIAEVKIAPADVAEILMAESVAAAADGNIDDCNIDACLKDLIQVLEQRSIKAEEEEEKENAEQKKAEKEETESEKMSELSEESSCKETTGNTGSDFKFEEDQ